jgi:hypothetical protein
MVPCKRKLDKAEQNGFDPAFLLEMLLLIGEIV